MDVNPALLDFYGIPGTGDMFRGLVPESCPWLGDESGGQIRSLIESSLHERHVIRREFLPKETGSGKTLLMIAKPIFGMNRDIDLILIEARDISDRKKVREDLGRRERQLRSLLDAIPSMIFVLDEHSRYLNVNQAFVKNEGGVSVENMIGRRAGDFHDDPDVVKQWEDENLMVLENQSTPAITVEEIVDADGIRHWTQTTKVACPEGVFDTPAVIAFSTDITRLKEAEEKLSRLNDDLEKRVEDRTAELKVSLNDLQEARDQLIRTERLAAFGSLVSSIAHELNTPLGNILMAVSFIGDECARLDGGGEPRESYREIMEASDLAQSALKQAASLVNRMKQTAVDGGGDTLEDFSLFKVSEETLTLYSGEFERLGAKTSVTGDTSVSIGGYPRSFRRIISILVENSIAHGFSGSEEPVISIDIEARDDSVSLVYRDNGCGIDGGDDNRIFEPFFTTKSDSGHSGLGLFLGRKLAIDRMGGSLEYIDDDGPGVRFRLTLPSAASSVS